MAKMVFTHQKGPDGKPVVVKAFQPTRAQKRSTQLMAFTPGPKTRGQKIARALWG